MNRVSIVILNWNGKHYLEQFLPSLVLNSQLPGVEIVVADNNSSDDSLEFLARVHPQIKVIRLDENYGFSGGYNRALKQLSSTYFLLLNSDIEVTPGWLEPLIDVMESNDRVAACTPKLKDFKNRSHFEYAGAAGGHIDWLGYPFCRGRIFDHLEEDLGQYDDPVEIFWGSGACLLVRSSLYAQSGGLDEQFFAHMEEIDLCWRFQRMGYQIQYVPQSTVYHVGGGTLARGNPRKTFLNFRNNLLLLYKNLPVHQRERTIVLKMILDSISALRFLIQGDTKDFVAVIRAHIAYYGMKQAYKGTKDPNILQDKHVIVPGIYPHSIVVEFFLKGKRRFNQLDQDFRQKNKEQ
ncbi:MAG: glycosyltransferase family 2 protein [Bacteroidetes bacterium]|nr:MAG: glycosyltransferase family 2 protein [Bacteroidota bacterium]